MTTPTPVYLLITAGRTDLKVLVQPDSSNVWYPDAGPKNCREFHQWMLDNPDLWTVAAPSDVEFNGQRILEDNPDLRLPDDVRLRFTPQNDLPLEVKGGSLAITDSKLLFIAPKLGSVAATLAERQEQNLIAFRGAVVLYTHRDSAHKKTAEEPIAIGFTLARLIAETFHMQLSSKQLDDPPLPIIDEVTYFPFLTGEENFEGANKENLNPVVTRRMEQLVRAVSGLDSKLHAYVATFGGLPEFKPFLHSLADLHFQGRWLPLQNPEQADQAFVPEQPFITDAGLVQARANALRLLKRWDIHGAAAALAHVSGKRAGNWKEVIFAFDQFTSGRGRKKTKNENYNTVLNTFTANPLAWKERIVIEHNNKKTMKDSNTSVPFRFLLPGLRAESALRGERWTEALNWTYTFYNAMLIDLIELLCRNLWNNDFIKIEDRNICFIEIAPTSSHLMMQRTDSSSNWFVPQDNNDIFYDDGYASNRPDAAFRKIAKIFPDDWENWKKAFNGYKNKECKDLRNQNTHKVLDPLDVKKIESNMIQAGLWEKQANGLTVVGTALAKGCLKTFQKQDCVLEIEALHNAAVKALIEN